jgi:hypothetical protein
LTGDHIRACRNARQLVADMHWRGMPVPPLYAHMAAEFQALVANGDYAAWLAGGALPGVASQPTGAVGLSPSSQSQTGSGVSGDGPPAGSPPTWRSAAAGSPRSWPR